MEIKKPKGTNDILPEEVGKWHYLENLLREKSETYGYKEIRTPMFEHTELFVRGVGDTTDIVGKEMYTFMDKGERSITLRPEGTASVCRAFLENKMYGDGSIKKLYYMGPMFRYERPQKGRYKQFNQYGVEFLGSKEPVTDADVIKFAVSLLDETGLKDLELHINSVGCPKCKPVYREALVEYFQDKKDQLCSSCLERLEKNPLRILDCKNESCKEASKDAPVMSDYLCEECDPHYKEVKEYLSASNVSFIENPRLVRGLDYYTNTAFEIIAKDFAAQGTVCGGGRYNGLVGSIGDRDVPGIGFAMGMERILLLMEEKNLSVDSERTLDYYIIGMGSEAEKLSFKLVNLLRENSYYAEIDYQSKSFKNRIKYADKLKAKYVIIIGENELEKNTVIIKDMEAGIQEEQDLTIFMNNLKGEQ